ncbi:ATP-binding protein [Geodermatophilus sp. CPCC 205506]|uniref:ATP-binding protein n=1 Tax=Geodermatophilus sp. CPCC 205506 TaxID=2936596 RepID=UPI003EE8E893
MDTTDAGRLEIHGRLAEEAAIAAVIEGARAGRSALLVVRGPPGIGKSTLLEHAVQGSSDLSVLRARGVESETELAFAALHQLLLPVLGHADHLPRHQRAVLRSALGMEDSLEGPVVDRFLIAVAVLGLLATAAEEQPVICLVDDAHWLDHASAATLLFVARRLGAERIGFVFAARDPDRHSFPTADLPELRLEGLDVDAAVALLGERTGRPVHHGVARRLVEWTAGNPLALIELPSVLTVQQLAGETPLPSPLPLPLNVERLFSERVRRLPDDARALLVVAAAEDTGRLGPILAAARSSGLPATALDAAERDGLVAVREDELRFPHPLVRSAVYQSATTSERRGAHLALSRAYRDVGDADRRAWHAAAAAWEPDENVVRELELVAARAAGRGGFGAAGTALARAAELSADGGARCRRLVAAAENAWMAGQLGHAAELLESARRWGSDPLLRADIGRLRGWLQYSVGSPAAARRIHIEAAGQVGGADGRRARELLTAAAESAWLSRDRDSGIEIRTVMSTLGPLEEARDGPAQDLLSGFLHLLEGNTRAGVRLIAESIRSAERLGDGQLMAAAAQHALYVGDDDAALRLSRGAVARARANGAVAELLFALPRLAHAEFLAGHWTAAAAGAAETVRLARGAGHEELSALPLAWLSLVSSLRGDDEDADTHGTELESLADGHELGVFRAPSLEIVRWGRSTRRLLSPRPASALVDLEGLAHPVVTAMATVDRVEAAVLAGDLTAAHLWSTRMEDLAEATGAPWALASAAHCRGVAADGPAAWEHFTEALRHHDAARRPFARGRTLLAYGEALRRARKRVAARPYLGAAMDQFQSLTATDWAQRARLELRACGETTARRGDPSALLRLTSQELQVARFVASGLPTRTVAAQLFLSPRTVDFHLRNVFAKLGISSRSELAAQSFD